MNTDFPEPTNSYLKPANFQDNQVTLTYLGWDKKANEDDPSDRNNAKTWKQKLKYQLRYSYPEWAVDEANEKLVGQDGQPFRNKFYDPNFPQGYTIVYKFEEGELETGSLPLFNAFCLIRPKSGDKVTISRTGEGKDTKWKVTKGEPVVDMDTGKTVDPEYGDLEPDEEVPF